MLQCHGWGSNPPVECIPHPYWMWAKCFTTMICYQWAYGSTLTLLCLAGLGWIFGDIGVDLSPSDVVKTWLKLQTHMDCCLHPYWINTMCFTILICYEWVYWSTLTLLCLCRLGVDIRGYWGRPEPEWCCNDMVEAQPLMDCFPHPNWMFYHHDMLWMGILVYPYTVMPVQDWGGFLEILG